MKYAKQLLVAIGVLVPLTAIRQEDASRLEKRFEKPPEPKSNLQPMLLPIGDQFPLEKAGNIKFVLKEMRFAGNTVFSSEELRRLYAELLGKEVTLLNIYRVRDAITTKYGNAGFGLSKAVVALLPHWLRRSCCH